MKLHLWLRHLPTDGLWHPQEVLEVPADVVREVNALPGEGPTSKKGGWHSSLYREWLAAVFEGAMARAKAAGLEEVEVYGSWEPSFPTGDHVDTPLYGQGAVVSPPSSDKLQAPATSVPSPPAVDMTDPHARLVALIRLHGQEGRKPERDPAEEAEWERMKQKRGQARLF